MFPLTNKQQKIVISISGIVAILIIAGIAVMYHKIKNPVIHSPKDITSDLIIDMFENNIDSLTIDYIFTGCPEDGSELLNGQVKDLLSGPMNEKEWIEYRKVTNPFMRMRISNHARPVVRLDFEIKFTEKVDSLNCAFIGFDKLEYVNIQDVSNIKSVTSMFQNAVSFNQPLDHWDTSNITDMSYMFAGAKSFNQPIGNWNTSKVVFMVGMFMNAKSFNQPIGNWNTSSVRDMSYMFTGAEAYSYPMPIDPNASEN